MLITGRDNNAGKQNAKKQKVRKQGKRATSYLPHNREANSEVNEHSQETEERGARSSELSCLSLTLAFLHPLVRYL